MVNLEAKNRYQDQYNIGHDIGRYWSILVSNIDHDIDRDIDHDMIWSILIVEILWSSCGLQHPVEILWSSCGDPVEFLWSLESCGVPFDIDIGLDIDRDIGRY